MLTVLLAGCRPEGVDGDVEYVFTRIATFTGNDGSGRARFEVYPPGSAQAVSLVAQSGLDLEADHLPARLYIRYENSSNDPDADGPITLLGAALISQGEVETKWSDKYSSWNSDEVYLYSMSVSGPYIDMRLGLPASESPRYFTLVVDPDDASDSDEATLILVHSFEAAPEPTFDRTYYASFSIKSLLARNPDLRRIKVTLNNSNLRRDLITLELPRYEE
ncbi:MAG: hypothetical protein K2K55_10530 [Duncaniella sp.]|nr:hypothetical protein [Duncaniella sp.]